MNAFISKGAAGVTGVAAAGVADGKPKGVTPVGPTENCSPDGPVIVCVGPLSPGCGVGNGNAPGPAGVVATDGAP